ncbi:MAG TPA: ATP-binding protein [Blastocatellia bacterium]|nr:ATP-binding protein [Blastocatellia bacterium]
MQKLPARLLGLPRTAEWIVRNVLLVGFFMLLMLVAGLGYLSWQSFRELEDEISIIRQSEVSHQSAVSLISETAGKIQAYARTALAYPESSLISFSARQSLKTLKVEMDERIRNGRLTSLSDTEQWREFETAFETYWAKINSKEAIDWLAEREQMTGAIAKLEHYVRAELEENDKRIKALSERERKKEGAATAVVLFVSFVVAVLTFYEIRKILKKLSLAYAESSASRDYLRSLLDSLDSGVVVIAEDGKVETVSRSFRTLTGLGAETEVKQDFKELFQDSPFLVEKISQGLSNPRRVNRYQGSLELGDRKLFDVFASPLVINEERRGMILVFVDMTETARTQAELRRNRALSAVGQMTAQIAHEIKNPLGSIRFATEVIKRRGPISQSDAETLAVIDRSVDHLATIVAELADFARPKELKRTEINLNNLLDDLMPMVADRLSVKRVGVEKHYSPDLPLGQYDATELKKLFLNLIINAIDASELGGSIELRTKVNGRREVTIEIADRGSGMDKETLSRLFEPFYTTKEKGTGLGMAIAKKITELHKGDLLITSKKGEGTTATVRLPII